MSRASRAHPRDRADLDEDRRAVPGDTDDPRRDWNLSEEKHSYENTIIPGIDFPRTSAALPRDDTGIYYIMSRRYVT